jgi:hypothetical protein
MPCALTYYDNNHINNENDNDNQNDNIEWCRGEILNVNDKELKCDILYVDYGNINYNVNYLDLKLLKRKYRVYSVDTFKCKLFGIKFNNINDETKAIQYMINLSDKYYLINNKLFVYDVKIINILQYNDNYTNNDSKLLKLSSISNHYYEIELYYTPYTDDTNIKINLNALFVYLNYAQCINDSLIQHINYIKQLNDDKFIHRPKSDPLLNKITKEIKSLLKINDKLIKFNDNNYNNNKPLNTRKCIVSNLISLNELWLHDKLDYFINYDKLHDNLKLYYSSILSSSSSSLSSSTTTTTTTTNISNNEWFINDICVYKYPLKKEYKRVKIIDKKKLTNNDYVYKIICLDDGIYEDNIKSNCLHELNNKFNSNEYNFLAIKCKLNGIEPLNKENKWGHKTNDYAYDLLVDNEIDVLFIENENDYKLIDIYLKYDLQNKPSKITQINDIYVNFSHMICTRGLATLSKKLIM